MRSATVLSLSSKLRRLLPLFLSFSCPSCSLPSPVLPLPGVRSLPGQRPGCRDPCTRIVIFTWCRSRVVVVKIKSSSFPLLAFLSSSSSCGSSYNAAASLFFDFMSLPCAHQSVRPKSNLSTTSEDISSGTSASSSLLHGSRRNIIVRQDLRSPVELAHDSAGALT